MTDRTTVDRLYDESVAILAAIPESEISLKNSASDVMRKALLLGAASYFEHRVTTSILEYVRLCVQDFDRVYYLVKNRALSRTYHTWFQWDQSNANTFFSMFGADFKDLMEKRVKSSDALSLGVKAFLEVGNDRNKLVHGDFASFTLEKTLDEIYAEYKKALMFIDAIRSNLQHESAEPVTHNLVS